MNPVITWIIERIDVTPALNGYTDVVITVFWRIKASDGKHVASTHDEQKITFNPTQPFISFADLTQDTVVGWVKDSLGAEKVASIISTLNDDLQSRAAPAFVSHIMPFSKQQLTP